MTANNDTELKPYIPASAQGERCSMCGEPAARKVCENIFHDDPRPRRHELTAYVCLKHFEQIMDRFGYTRAASGQSNQEAVKILGYARRCINNVISAGPMGSTTFEQGVSARDYIDQAISALTTPSISLPQLKAICDGMKMPVGSVAQSRDMNINAAGFNLGVDQVYEAAEKAVRDV